MARTNQYKPCPPEDDQDFVTAIRFYYGMGVPDTKAVELLKKVYDTEKYGFSLKSLKRWRTRLGLQSTRQQKHTFETIKAKVDTIRQNFPMRGANGITKQLRLQYNIRVSRHTVSAYLHMADPDGVKARRQNRLRRKRFYAAGVNDVWVQDQHDKWGERFGLWLHNNMDPFTGFNNWMMVWWTNKNPRLIASYYFKAVRKLGAIPVTTQSDPGSENYGVANVHTLARHALDPSLVDTLQHRWMSKKKNVKSEANWSVLRADFSPGFEDLFEYGVQRGWYNVDIPLEKLIFQWIAIPWLQQELDGWVTLRNKSAPRHNKHKVLPHGPPELIRLHPEEYDTKDFKIPVPSELIDRLEAEFAPPDHPVFELSPPAFDLQANIHYNSLGKPPINQQTFWDVFNGMKNLFVGSMGPHLQAIVEEHIETVKRVNEDDVAIPSHLKELRNGAPLMGDGGQASNWDPQSGGDIAAYLTSSSEGDDVTSSDESSFSFSEEVD